MLRSATIAATLLASAAACAPAVAHVRLGEDNWLFTGSTYRTDQDRNESPRREHRADPVTVIWRGPSGTDATIRRARDHTEADWTERTIPGGYPRGARMRPRINPGCTDPQFVFYRRGMDPNDGAWTQSRAYMSTNATCGNQYHLRMYSSALHGQFFAGAEHQNEWVLAPIHHERLIVRLVPQPFPLPPRLDTDHRIDLPWDGARRVYLHAMRIHCTQNEWAMHPESTLFRYGRYVNSGIISRISFRHDSEGCDGDAN